MSENYRQRKYCPPDHQIGQVVHFFPGGQANEIPMAATVACTPGRCIELHVRESRQSRTMVLNGIYHVDDPALNLPDVRSRGAWDHTPLHKRFLKVEEYMLSKARDESRLDPTPDAPYEDLRAEAITLGVQLLPTMDHCEIAQAVFAKKDALLRAETARKAEAAKAAKETEPATA